MSRESAEDFSRLADVTNRYQPGARRFDVSAKSSFSNIAGATAALQLLCEWGVTTISEALAETNARIAGILSDHGFETSPPGQRASHFQAARLPSTDPRTLAAELVASGVYASVRGQHLRVAPHVYTDDEDLARFDATLRDVLA